MRRSSQCPDVRSAEHSDGAIHCPPKGGSEKGDRTIVSSKHNLFNTNVKSLKLTLFLLPDSPFWIPLLGTQSLEPEGRFLWWKGSWVLGRRFPLLPCLSRRRTNQLNAQWCSRIATTLSGRSSEHFELDTSLGSLCRQIEVGITIIPLVLLSCTLLPCRVWTYSYNNTWTISRQARLL